MKYITQYVNVYSNEVLRETEHADAVEITTFIKHFENVEKNRGKSKNKDIIIVLDSDMKMWNAEYISYMVNENEKNEGITYYRLLFKVRRREEQINFDKINNT